MAHIRNTYKCLALVALFASTIYWIYNTSTPFVLPSLEIIDDQFLEIKANEPWQVHPRALWGDFLKIDLTALPLPTSKSELKHLPPTINEVDVAPEVYLKRAQTSFEAAKPQAHPLPKEVIFRNSLTQI